MLGVEKEKLGAGKKTGVGEKKRRKKNVAGLGGWHGQIAAKGAAVFVVCRCGCREIESGCREREGGYGWN